MKKIRWIAVVGAAVVLLPWSLVAQTDTGLSPQPDQQSAMPPGPNGANGAQPAVPGSMRETLGAPGQMGQQLEDKAFVRTATEDGIADVKLGQLAIQKGGPEVKAFAEKIVPDHEAINKEFATVADSLGVLLPKKMNKDDQAEYDKLNGLSGKEFDTEYIPFILKAHRKKLHDFYMEASVAVDPTLASTVFNAMRTMHDHLGMIAEVAKQDGIALPPRPPRPGPPPPNSPPPPPPPVAKQ
jgi:putative membrane protein